jgi:hypothetical protein
MRSMAPGYSAKIGKNVVSEALDVTSILTSVSLGEADAGFVYVTDARSASGKVRSIDLPPQAQAVASYPIAVVDGAGNAAVGQEFTSFVAGLRPRPFCGRRASDHRPSSPGSRREARNERLAAVMQPPTPEAIHEPDAAGPAGEVASSGGSPLPELPQREPSARHGRAASVRRRSARRAPVGFVPLAAVGLAFLALPLAGLVVRTPWRQLPTDLAAPGVLTALRLSLVCSSPLWPCPV